jgi:hypothetical protein
LLSCCWAGRSRHPALFVCPASSIPSANTEGAAASAPMRRVSSRPCMRMQSSSVREASVRANEFLLALFRPEDIRELSGGCAGFAVPCCLYVGRLMRGVSG